MDLSSVKLSAFEKPRLAVSEVLIATKGDLQPDIDHESDDSRDTIESTELIDDDLQGTREIASSSVFKVKLIAGQPALQEASRASIHAETGFALAVTQEGTCVWRYNPQRTISSNSLLFPSSGDALATFVSPIPGFVEPGIVIIDPYTGLIRYWESVGSAVTIDLLEDDSGRSGPGSINLSLHNNEKVTHVVSIEPVGIVLATSSGAFVLVNLRDTLGKRRLRLTSLKRSHDSGSGLLRFIGVGSTASKHAWQHIASVRPGRQLNEAERLVYLANRRGDVAIWRCGIDGTASMVTEASVGSLLHQHMDILYSNAGSTLQLLDLAEIGDQVQVLASFEPIAGEPLRYFLLVSLTTNTTIGDENSSGDAFVIESMLRLQAYESQVSKPSNGKLVAPLGSSNDAARFAVFDDAIVIVEPRNATNELEPRWEETLALKASVNVLGAQPTAQGVAVILDSGIMDVVALPQFAHNPDFNAPKIRLEQAVFFARSANPLDLERWPEWSYQQSSSDPVAQFSATATTLSNEISDATSPYIPSQLPSVRAHCALRLDRLLRLARFVSHNGLVTDEDLTTITAQVIHLASAESLWISYESSPRIKLQQFTKPVDVRQWFLSKITNIPAMLDWLARQTSQDASDALTTALVASDTAALALGCRHPGFSPQITETLERLTHAAIANEDAARLEPLSSLLCLAYESQDKTISNDRNLSLTHLLLELSRFGDRAAALKIAERFRVWTAFARIIGEIWLTSSDHVERAEVEAEIRYLLDHPEHNESTRIAVAHAFFGFLVDSKQTKSLLVNFVPTNKDLVIEFLKSRGLERVAWTIDPQHSLDLLKASVGRETVLSPKQVMASIAKLAAIASDNVALASYADRELQLLTAQKLVEVQIQQPNIPRLLPVSHAQEMLQAGQRLLNSEELVDLLTFLPVSSTNALQNFSRAFALVGSDDTVRQRAIVQQMVLQTPWEELSRARTDSERSKLARQTPWFLTVQQIPKAYIARISDLSFCCQDASTSEILETYSWAKTSTQQDLLIRELENLTLETRRACEIYDVERWGAAITAEAQAAVDSDLQASEIIGDTQGKPMEESIMILS